MKPDEYRRTIERFEPDPALRERIGSAICEKAPSGGLIRAAVGVVAGILIVVLTAGAAMAASPELRAAVLSLLRIGTEDVPGDVPGGAPVVSTAVIGGTVEAQYIRLDGAFDVAGDGLLRKTGVDPDTGAVIPVSFWDIVDNAAVPVYVEVHRSELSVDLDGAAFNVIFYWYEHNGELGVFDPGLDPASGGMRDVKAQISAFPGRTDAVMVELDWDGHREYREYDLSTGEARDILAGKGVDDLKSAVFAPDMSGGLLARGSGWSYIDLGTGEIRTLSELTGVRSFDTACFLDDGSIQLLRWIDAQGLGAGSVDCWIYDPAASSTTKVLDGKRVFNEFNEPRPYGVVLLGGYCLDIDGEVRVLDLRTGTSTVIEGYTYDPEDTLCVSPDGDKILYARFDDSGMMFVTRLGVINLAEGAAIEFDRVKPEGGLFEFKCRWLDNDRAAISGTTPDGGMTSLYIYKT